MYGFEKMARDAGCCVRTFCATSITPTTSRRCARSAGLGGGAVVRRTLCTDERCVTSEAPSRRWRNETRGRSRAGRATVAPAGVTVFFAGTQWHDAAGHLKDSVPGAAGTVGARVSFVGRRWSSKNAHRLALRRGRGRRRPSLTTGTAELAGVPGVVGEHFEVQIKITCYCSRTTGRRRTVAETHPRRSSGS